MFQGIGSNCKIFTFESQSRSTNLLILDLTSHSTSPTLLNPSVGMKIRNQSTYLWNIILFGDIKRYFSRKSSLDVADARRLTHQILEGLHQMCGERETWDVARLG